MSTPDKPVTQRQQLKEIREGGFLRGEEAGAKCDSCGKKCGRGWWTKVSFEYNEWQSYCRECAYREIHKWDELTEGENCYG